MAKKCQSCFGRYKSLTKANCKTFLNGCVKCQSSTQLQILGPAVCRCPGQATYTLPFSGTITDDQPVPPPTPVVPPPLTAANVINRSSLVTDAQVQAMIPIIQNQINNEFAAAWGATTTLTFAATLDPLLTTLDPLLNYYVIFTDAVDVQGAYGYHYYSPCPPCSPGQPPALPTYNTPGSKVWAKIFPPICGTLDLMSQTFSHEAVEFLADPVIQTYSNQVTLNGVTGKFLVEVSDPITGQNYNSNQLVDFVFPNWYVPNSTGPWDHLGVCTAPFQTIGQGYATFYTTNGTRLTWKNGNFLMSLHHGLQENPFEPIIHHVIDPVDTTFRKKHRKVFC